MLQVMPDAPYITTKEAVLQGLLTEKVFGIIVCDLHVPDNLKEYFKDFAPIIKHANINLEDIGDFMEEVAQKSNVRVKDRRCVIDSYYGQQVGLIDEYMVWLIKKGVVVDRIHTYLRFNKDKVFKNFTNKITELRAEGDRNKSCEGKALTAKLIGNSAFGSCITNKDQFRQVELRRIINREAQVGRYNSELKKEELVSLNTFIKYEVVGPRLLEVESRHKKIFYDQLRYVGKTIFDRAKLSVLKFYYDFLKEILKPRSYQLMETDTASIYVALEKESSEDNIAEDKREVYEQLKHEYFITDKCKYGKREPYR